jgi:hypothetical protein
MLGLVHTRLAAIVVVSALVIVPCFWQRRLEAGDLGSHIYNAWLAQLIERGQAPGLWIARQWNNVLFDLILSGLGKVFSLDFAACSSAALAVLTFFWGAFTFIAALTKRSPWFVCPVIGIMAYGWCFNYGLFNYYLSVGLAFIALAILLRTRGWKRLGALAFVPVIFLAHPLGLLWMLGGAVYIAAAQRILLQFHIFLVLTSVAVIAAARIYLEKHFRLESVAHFVLLYNGLDQIVLTNRFELVVALFSSFLLFALAVEVRRRGITDVLASCAIPLSLYLIAEAAVRLLPDTVHLPQYGAPLSDLAERLTLISAVFLCCLLGTVQPRHGHWVATSAIALVFFAFLYQDTARINRMHERVDALVHSLPPGQRLIFRVAHPPKYRFRFEDILDESCVGYCFSYGNYEPAAQQFRVRASPGNAFVMTDTRDVSSLEEGTYRVEPRDLPLFQIYQCGNTWTDLCLRSLAPGQSVNSFDAK